MNESSAITLHLIGNAHLDPVWLWDAREGLNEGITTARSILNLMDEEPEMTFIRGESAIYEHIEKNDPATFHRIVRQVENLELLPRLACDLERPPLIMAVAPHEGEWPRAGSLAALFPENLDLLALKPVEDGAGFILRVQAPAGTNEAIPARLRWISTDIDLGEIQSHEIASWRLQTNGTAWTATRVNLTEPECQV